MVRLICLVPRTGTLWTLLKFAHKIRLSVSRHISALRRSLSLFFSPCACMCERVR